MRVDDKACDGQSGSQLIDKPRGEFYFICRVCLWQVVVCVLVIMLIMQEEATTAPRAPLHVAQMSGLLRPREQIGCCSEEGFCAMA